MQSRYGRDTVALGFVAISLVVLVSCVGAARLSMDLARSSGPSLGDHVFLAQAASASGPAWVAKAHLPSGAACDIGLGPEAGAGGELYVVTREANGDVGAIWTSKGRSAASGADCGNGAQVSIDGLTFSSLRSASRGVSPLAPPETPSVF